MRQEPREPGAYTPAATRTRTRVPYSYLERQFSQGDPYLHAIREVVAGADFTLGRAVAEFERRFARLVGLPHAVGVGSGTDALVLCL